MAAQDYDVTGQNGNDYRNSCENWCNIGIYLVDQTPEQGPLWVVPGSNRLPRQMDIGRHGDDFNAHFSPHARMVCAQAGDAVTFHLLTFARSHPTPAAPPPNSQLGANR